jgi:hypothetical protein
MDFLLSHWHCVIPAAAIVIVILQVKFSADRRGASFCKEVILKRGLLLHGRHQCE